MFDFILQRKNRVPRKKKAVFVPKKKKTLIPEPNWNKLKKAKTDEEQLNAWKECDDYAHFEITDKEMIHSLKRWIELDSGWSLFEKTKIIPDVFLQSYAKHAWKTRQLGYMPSLVKKLFESSLKPLLEKADKFKKTDSLDLVVDEDSAWHPKKVKEWLKHWQGYVKSIASWKESSDFKLRMQHQVAETYVYNLNQYLRNGIWSDSHWGENREFKVLTVCKALSYDSEGNVKRTVGVYYPDIGQMWTKEMNYDTR